MKQIFITKLQNAAYCNLELSSLMRSAFKNGFGLQRILQAIQIKTVVGLEIHLTYGKD